MIRAFYISSEKDYPELCPSHVVKNPISSVSPP
jgi:hypothetical protein